MKLSSEVAIGVQLAETTVPFARSQAGKAERWLRVLRRLEHTGQALSALGVADGPLESRAEARVALDPDGDGYSVQEVEERAATYARARGGDVIGSIDLLFGVIGVYGDDFSRALYRHGVTRSELFDYLAMQVEEKASPLIR